MYYPATIVGLVTNKEDMYNIIFDNDDSKTIYKNVPVIKIAIGSNLNGSNKFIYLYNKKIVLNIYIF